MYRFNDTVDRAVLKPVAKSYQEHVPAQMRRGVRNFFSNLGMPIVIANDLLQFKPRAALSATGRFLLNSTVGLAGFFDPATRLGLREHDEDFGQTLGRWGVPEGPYLVLPFLGPSSLRDAPSLYADALIDPTYQTIETPEQYGAIALEAIDIRARLLDADEAIAGAFDPYAFVREAWLQRRRYLVHDGNPPVEYPDDEEFEEDLPEDDLPAPDAAQQTDEVPPQP